MRSSFLIRRKDPNFHITVAREEVAKVQLQHHLPQMDLTIFKSKDKGGDSGIGDLFLEPHQGLEFLDTVLTDT